MFTVDTVEYDGNEISARSELALNDFEQKILRPLPDFKFTDVSIVRILLFLSNGYRLTCELLVDFLGHQHMIRDVMSLKLQDYFLVGDRFRCITGLGLMSSFYPKVGEIYHRSTHIRFVSYTEDEIVDRILSSLGPVKPGDEILNLAAIFSPRYVYKYQMMAFGRSRYEMTTVAKIISTAERIIRSCVKPLNRRLQLRTGKLVFKRKILAYARRLAYAMIDSEVLKNKVTAKQLNDFLAWFDGIWGDMLARPNPIIFIPTVYNKDRVVQELQKYQFFLNPEQCPVHREVEIRAIIHRYKQNPDIFAEDIVLNVCGD